MNFEVKHVQPVVGCWVSYCARARDLQNAEKHDDEMPYDKKPNSTEGRSLANDH
jgi:hypothetical protein